MQPDKKESCPRSRSTPIVFSVNLYGFNAMTDFLNCFQLVISHHPRLEKSLGHFIDHGGHISNGQTEAFYQFCNRHGPVPLLFRLLRPHYVVRKAFLLGDVPERLTV